MTSGTISRTSPDGLSVFQKTWTGANGKTVENPYSCDLRQVRKKKCEYWSVGWYQGKEFSRSRNPPADYCYFDSLLPVLAPTGNQDLQALAKLATQIRGHDFNLGVFGAESKQTINLIRDTTLGLIGAFDAARKGDFARLIRLMKQRPKQEWLDLLSKKIRLGDFSGALLALRYGWQPLLQDLYEMMKAFKGRTAKRQVTFRATQTVTKSANVGYDPVAYPVPGQQTCTIKYKVIFTEQLSKSRELGLLDPATVLWEKTPWSFVFDWFIPIGTYLADLSFFSFFKPAATRTVYQLTDAAVVNISMWKGNLPPVGNDWLANMSYVGKRIVLTRTVGPISVPSPNFKTLEKAFSKTHLENAAALIHQQLSGAAGRDVLKLPKILR